MKRTLPLLLALTLIPAAALANEGAQPSAPPATDKPAVDTVRSAPPQAPRDVALTAKSREDAEQLDAEPTSWSNVKALWGN